MPSLNSEHMASSCSESDPRKHVEQFVRDPSIKSISGTRDGGLQALYDLIKEEIKKQDPEVEILTIDRDFLSDHRIITAKELGSCLIDITFGKKYAIFMDILIPVVNWQEILEYLNDETSLFVGSLACRQVPLCTRIH